MPVAPSFTATQNADGSLTTSSTADPTAINWAAILQAIVSAVPGDSGDHRGVFPDTSEPGPDTVTQPLAGTNSLSLVRTPLMARQIQNANAAAGPAARANSVANYPNASNVKWASVQDQGPTQRAQPRCRAGPFQRLPGLQQDQRRLKVVGCRFSVLGEDN